VETVDELMRSSASMDEENFWQEVYNLNVAEFAKTFGPKWLPETRIEGDRFLIGVPDWNAILAALKHIQGYLDYMSEEVAYRLGY